jgi:hypothetical protein
MQLHATAYTQNFPPKHVRGFAIRIAAANRFWRLAFAPIASHIRASKAEPL